jgi:diaminopimelate decarboxylase
VSALVTAGVAVRDAIDALRRRDPDAHAFYLYDLDALAARAARFTAAFQVLPGFGVYAMKANGLLPIVECLAQHEIGADAGSLGELELARAAGIHPSHIVLNGNGRTREEAAWVARTGIHSVNADHIDELDLLQAEAAAVSRSVRVALRINPGIETPGHAYVATGHDEAKFGVAPAEAIEALATYQRWPNLDLRGLHVHVGSQVHDPAPMLAAAERALELVKEVRARNGRVEWINLGGGFGIGPRDAPEFPLETHAQALAERFNQAWESRAYDGTLVFEPGRWLVAPIGMLVAEVLWVKRRDKRRFVVLGAGMNDFLRPALYGARHMIVPVEPRAGAPEPAIVVGPVCESGDVFESGVLLPPLQRGDWVAFLDAGAYGWAMSSNYNGRGRLAEVVARDGELRLARAAESPATLRAAASGSSPLS